MDYISATKLRTEAKKLRDSLAKGKETYLVHRSEIIGVISPVVGEKDKPVQATKEKLQKLSKHFSSGKTYSYAKRDALRRKYLEKKYGPSVS